MNPEEVRALWERVQKAREAGFSDREINSLLRREDSIPFNSVRVLERVAINLGVAPSVASQEAEGGGVRQEVSDILAPVLQGATMSLGSDFLEGMEKVGLVREGAGQRNQDRVRQARERHPIRSGVLQVVGSVLGAPGAVAKGVLTPAVRGAAALAGRGGAALARTAGAGPLGQLGANVAARGIGASVAGGAAGAAEGGLIGFGEAAGQESRGDAAKTGAVWGGLLGAPLAGLGSAVSSVKGVRQEIQQAGDALAGTAERVAAGLPTRRGVAGQVREIDAVRQAAFGEAEASGAEATAGVLDLLLESRPARAALRRVGSEEARRVERQVRRLLRGRQRSGGVEVAPVEGLLTNALPGATPPRTPPAPQISFRLADDIRKELTFLDDAFARRLPDASGKVPGTGKTREAGEALARLDAVLEAVPGNVEGRVATAAARSMERAYETGRKLANQPLDVVQDVMGGEVVRRGRQRIRLQMTPDNVRAARAGLAEPILTQLRGGREAAASFIKKVETSGELQGRLRIILGSDEAYRSFIEEANRLRAIGQADKIAESLIKAAGFIGFGSSLFGGALSTGLLSP